jgi:hypothetical protein
MCIYPPIPEVGSPFYAMAAFSCLSANLTLPGSIWFL